MIQELVNEQGEARVTVLAKHFGVTPVTAHKIVARLQREKLVTSKPYRSVFLTEHGKRLAKQSRERHHIVYTFLRKLGVPEPIANTDAEGMEHHVSPETLSKMKAFLKTKI